MIVDSNDLPSKLDARILPQLVCVLLLCVANALAVGPSSDQPRCPDGLTTSSAVWSQDVSVSVPLAYSLDQGFRGLSSEVLYPGVLFPGSRGPVQSNPRLRFSGSRGPVRSNPRLRFPGSRGLGLNLSTIDLRTLGPSRTVYGPEKSYPQVLFPGSRGPGLNLSTIDLRTLGPSRTVYGPEKSYPRVLFPGSRGPGSLNSPLTPTNVAPWPLLQGLMLQLVIPGSVQSSSVATRSQALMQGSILSPNKGAALLFFL